MSIPQPCRLPGFAATLLLGIVGGWVAANHRIPTARAYSGGADRVGDYAVTTAPVMLEYNERTKIQAPQDALFFLDYRAARLVMTIPNYRQINGKTQLIDGFTGRDLVADFKLGESSPQPHFVMTAGALGAKGVGWAPLYVFETTSRQVAVYRVEQLAIGAKSKPKFELLEVQSFAPTDPLPTLPDAGLGGAQAR